MKILILWTGIAAFVLIGLFPPEARWNLRHIDAIRLLCDWAIVAVLTGGLLWSEAQVSAWVRTRLYPWIKAKRQGVLGLVTVGVVLFCLAAIILMTQSGW